ncbi:hypothetical protein LO763_18840 [Glycomyces sp. A-F 0318]|uniref:WXG100 family type VII secretion target n=1 Tax=Glycomyces amatae TaxID=2881355 RepID=UPI001E58DEFD|nr:hypothetical protein [Glycomyces amatae]MCD0445667.1 hypothetical protein [Glycomyces amatae]
MGMQIPGELAGLLSMLGYDWPESDEESIFNLAGEWTGMASQIGDKVERLNSAAATLLENNTGADIEAFREEYEDAESAARNLAGAADPAGIINIGLTIAAGIVLALKVQVIVQLMMLAFQIAQAIATAAVTFGASLVQIPIFKMITGMIIDQLIGMALDMVLNG